MAERSFLILHGLANHRPVEHWQFLLAARLHEAGSQVLYPQLPDPDSPRLTRWHAELDRLLGELEAAERVVICHSLGCLLWLHAAPGLGAGTVDRVLLVAPPSSDRLPEEAASFRIGELDADLVRAASGELRVACSREDEWNSVGAERLYAEPLGCEADVIDGSAHLNPDSGYGRWRSLERWCEDPSVRLTAAALG